MLRKVFIAFFALVAIVQIYAINADSHRDGKYFVLEDEQGYRLLLESDKVRLYVDAYRHIAISEMDRSGVPASIKMAQGILESGSGQSELARKGHNHFGIKCGGQWSGKTFYMWDDDVVKSCFRVYARDEESYIAHTEFLTDPKKNGRYGSLFKLERTDYKAWANGLQKAGYATSKTYARNLISLIERFELYKLDYLTFKAIAVAKDELDSIFQLPKIEPIPEPTDTMMKPEIVLIPDPFGDHKELVRMNLTKAMFKINGTMAVFVQPGDNLDDIVYRYNTTVKKIRKYNEMPVDSKLYAGQYIFLNRKKSTYSGKEVFHLVREGQTLYDIAQHYGLQVKSLEKLNRIYKGTEPRVGTKIRLQK